MSGKRRYAPATINGWLSILRVIMKAAKRELALSHLATEGVKDIDESEHETYTEEEPNSLLPHEVSLFLTTLRELYPQHYAMTFLGLVTGLRPSSLRPLRRSGPMADIVWDECKLLVRRSHSLGDEVMNTTKQRVRYRIHLPESVLDVLRWHVDTQLTTPEQKDSELLFPAVTGGFRAPSTLNKPFADVAKTIGLGKQFTQRGLRSHVQRPRARGGGRSARHALDLGAPHRAHAAPLLDRQRDRAAERHRARRAPLLAPQAR